MTRRTANYALKEMATMPNVDSMNVGGTTYPIVPADGTVTIPKIASDLSALIYGAYPTDTLSGAAIATALGADGLPVKSMTVTASSPGEYTLRQTGKNIMDTSAADIPSTSDKGRGMTFKTTNDGFHIYGSPSADASSRTSIIGMSSSDGIIIGTRLKAGVTYAFSATYENNSVTPPSGKTLTALDLNTFKLRILLDGGGSAEISNGESLTMTVDGTVTRVSAIGWNDISTSKYYDFTVKAMLEVAGTPSAAWEKYNVIHDYPVTIAVADTPTAVDGVATALGANTFYIVPQTGVTATIDATLYLDPTLADNALKG